MKCEFYKLFVKRKAWLLILICMLLRLVTVFLQPNPSGDYRMEIYRASYLRHLEVLAGKLNDEKAAYIDEENRMLRSLQEHNSDAVIREYTRDEITEAEFDEQIRIRNTGRQRRDEFSVVNEQYERVKQNPERIYFMYTNGWTGLLGNEHLDYVLLVLLTVLTVPVICSEYTSDMYPVLRTTVNGGARLYVAKTVVSIITVMLSVILLFSMECTYYAAVQGLPDGSFPLQSLPPFADSPYAVSIYGAAALTLLNRCFGAVFLTLLLLCLSALLRRAMSAAFLGTMSIFLPLILFPQSEMTYLFPSPLGFLYSCGFLKSRFPVKPNAPEYLTVTPEQYLKVLCISSGILIVLFLIGLTAFSGIRIRHRKIRTAISIMFLLFLTGCTNRNAFSDIKGVIYDQWHYRPVTEDYAVIENENTEKTIVYRNSGAQISLLHDCFADRDVFQSCLLPFLDGETVYYLQRCNMYHEKIIALNLQDYSEQTVYEINSSYHTEDADRLFGLGYYLPHAEQEHEMIESYFVHNRQLYLSKTSGIFCYDLHTKTETCISGGRAQNLAATCGYVFYFDELFDLYRFDPENGCTEKLPFGKTNRFYAVENGLYCKYLKDGTFYFVTPDGERKEPLNDFHEDAFLKGAEP